VHGAAGVDQKKPRFHADPRRCQVSACRVLQRREDPSLLYERALTVERPAPSAGENKPNAGRAGWLRAPVPTFVNGTERAHV